MYDLGCKGIFFFFVLKNRICFHACSCVTVKSVKFFVLCFVFGRFSFLLILEKLQNENECCF